MDEEVGDPENGGISYDSVDKFYDWLKSYNKHLGYFNFELILPHHKCVAIMRVRRNQTKYQTARDVWNNQYRLEEEMKTCLLIRNGQNLWVIHSKMNFETKLFPDVEEFQKLLSEFDHGNNERLLNKYRNGMILIQGLFDRTDILAPQGTLNLLNMESIDKGLIKYNYAKTLIEDAKDKKFFKWIFNTPAITEGTRILFQSFGDGGTIQSRVTKYYRSEYGLPGYPDQGIYTIEYYENRPSIKYLPNEQVYDVNTLEYRPRKKRERVFVKSGDNIIDFDEFSHRDLEYINGILYNRKHRKDYLWLVPILKAVKTFKNLEFEEERPFMLMLKNIFPELPADTILDYIFHWKTKNKWKRSLKADDNKAYRMIVAKIKKDITNNTLIKLSPNFSN